MEIRLRKYGRHKLANEADTCLRTLFRDTPLYSKIPLTEELREACLETLYVHGLKLDTWCIRCKRESTFTLEPLMNSETRAVLDKRLEGTNKIDVPYKLESSQMAEALRWIVVSCARDKAHSIGYVCRHQFKLKIGENNKPEVFDLAFSKIGQEPSPADISKVEIQKYAKELSEADLREFNRAIGLASHSVGIGSFVYLRRILERVVDQTARENLTADQLTEFAKQRIKEKIGMLKDWLPSFLAGNTSLYAVLSKGIHELTEEECLAAFEPCRVGIELVLDEHIAKKEKERKIESVSRKLSDLSTEDNPTR